MRQNPVGEPAATAAWNFGTPRRRSSLKRLGPFCHCRQRYERSLRRIHASRLVSTLGVWQKPKYPRHPRRYGVRSSTNRVRLIPRVRRVLSRICTLNLSRALDAMRRSLPSFEMLNPRNLRSSGRATALFASLTRRVPAFLQNLQQGLLDQSVDDARHAELSDPALRLGDFNPLDRPRLVGSFEQLRPNAWPVLTQVVLRVVNGHPIDARTALVLANAFPRSYEIPSVTHLLH